MPLTFTVNQADGYFTAKYIGTITEEEVVRGHKLFFFVL